METEQEVKELEDNLKKIKIVQFSFWKRIGLLIIIGLIILVSWLIR